MKRLAFAISTVSSTAALLVFSACNGAESSNINSKFIQSAPAKPMSAAAGRSDPRSYQTDIMLFTGDGAWSTEVRNLENILGDNGATYDEVGSDQLNSMSVDDITHYGLVLFPGGQGGLEASSLTEQTHANLRAAVQERGVSYFGICAGAFIAEAPNPAPGQDVKYGLGIVDGPVLDYYHLEEEGTEIAMTMHTFADGTKADILWYGGPITPNVPGGVIAKYPDGNPAMSQLWSGKGFVILSGGHPTADEETLNVLGVSSADGIHQDIAWKLIDAALHRAPLKAF